MKFDKEKFNEKLGAFAHDAKNIALDVTDKTKDAVVKTKDLAFYHKWNWFN